MFTVARNWRARRRLRIAIEMVSGGGHLRARVRNASFRPVTLKHVDIAWPYRRVKLRDRLESLFKHGHHWATIGWTHHRMSELEQGFGFPLDMAPRQSIVLDIPIASVKGAFDGDEMRFVVKLRDVRGRNYYSGLCRISPK